MWPWGHAAVGYLLYAVFTRLSYREVPGDRATLVLALATQLPDMIDKPLAYSVHVLPGGRSLAHSLVFAVPVCVGVWYVARSQDRAIGEAFVIGYGSHLLGDSYGALLGGRFDELSYLVWPFLAPPDYPTESFLRHWELLVEAVMSVTLSGALTGQLPGVVYQAVMAFLVVVLWVFDGAPGLRYLYAKVRATSGWIREAIAR